MPSLNSISIKWIAGEMRYVVAGSLALLSSGKYDKNGAFVNHTSNTSHSMENNWFNLRNNVENG